jgi:hypothetical protein
MPCPACDNTGEVLAFKDRPLSVSSKQGYSRLWILQKNETFLLQAVRTLTADTFMRARLQVAVRFGPFSTTTCPWCGGERIVDNTSYEEL